MFALTGLAGLVAAFAETGAAILGASDAALAFGGFAKPVAAVRQAFAAVSHAGNAALAFLQIADVVAAAGEIRVRVGESVATGRSAIDATFTERDALLRHRRVHCQVGVGRRRTIGDGGISLHRDSIGAT